MLRNLASRRSLASRCFSTSVASRADYSHTVIGGGAVGLAVAAELAQNPSHRVLVIEKNSKTGQETLSRNSEVIHAGIYYPVDSLKLQLCIEGKNLIYNQAAIHGGVEVQKCGKWVVAQNDIDDAYLEKLYYRSKETGVPTEFVPLHKAKYIEPAIVANRSILNSPTSGILSAHSFIDYLFSMFQAQPHSDLAENSEVIAVTRSSGDYELLVKDSINNEEVAITSEIVINSAGLLADKIHNMVLPESKHLHYQYAKGNYFTLNSDSANNVSGFPVRRLIYPTPMPGLKGLGTHLTIALDGQIKFGPDHELIGTIDYKPNSKNIAAAVEQISKYYPIVHSEDQLVASYSGIRPQLKRQAKDAKFQDFVIKEESSEGLSGFVNLLNIDSPGLTSSMAIGKYVYRLLHG